MKVREEFGGVPLPNNGRKQAMTLGFPPGCCLPVSCPLATAGELGQARAAFRSAVAGSKPVFDKEVICAR
jgi:hypothetical protein